MSAASQMDAAAVEGGFANPVFDAQEAFSAVMTAMARPGTVVACGERVAPPAPLGKARGAVLAALADPDTGVALLDEADTPAIHAWLGFQTGAPVVPAARAVFAVAPAPERTLLERLPLGTPTHPDRSATVLAAVAGFEAGEAFTLAGPGIDGERRVRVEGLPADFLEMRAANHALAPCGLDFLLACGSRLMALPRSTVVTKG